MCPYWSSTARLPAAALHPPLLAASTPNTSIQLGLVKLVLATLAVRSDSSSSLLIPEIRQQRLAGHRYASHIHPVPWYTQTGGGAAGPARPAHSLLHHVHPPDGVSHLRGGAQQFHYLT